ncbi:unnamed protein product, partial [Amoebophrya sp. A120]|eukprot:GSA120T00024411001.1
MEWVRGHEEDLINGPEAEGLKQARTNRLIALNICDEEATWTDLKDFIGCITQAAPTYVNIYQGHGKKWAVLEFQTLRHAQLAIQLVNGQLFRGSTLYLRQDREDRTLEASCKCCCEPRNNTVVGEWW